LIMGMLNHTFGVLIISSALLSQSAIASRAAETGHSENIPASETDNGKITIKVRNATLRDCIEIIENQSKYLFVYGSDINIAKVVSIDVREKDINEVVGTLCSLLSMDYSIKGYYVVLSAKADSKLKGNETSSNKPILGIIRDIDGKPVAGASIIEKGTSKWTVTDDRGHFSIDAEPGARLEVSFLGYVPEEVEVKGNSRIEVRLSEDLKPLDEVVVVGYGIQSKALLTGSMASTSGEDLKHSSSANLSQGLAGRLSGVIVNNRSGEPGNDNASMLIRGRSTLGDNTPLIVIDGIAGRGDQFSRLSADEIESITVLKDASAAIYGSRSANGVILVTTKRGVKSAKPTVEFTYDFGLQQPTRLPEMADAVLYATAVNASNAIDNEAPKYSKEDIDKYSDGSDQVLFPNTNWYKSIIKDFAAQHRFGVTVRGGADRVKYFVSLGLQDQDGIYRKGATSYVQYNMRSNIDLKITDWLKTGIDFSIREQHKNYSAFPSNNYGIFYATMRAVPTSAPYYPNGYLRGGMNPAIMVQDKTGYDRTKSTTLNSSFYATLDFGKWVEGLTFEGRVAYDKDHSFNKVWRTPWNYYSYDEVTETYEEQTYTYWPTPTLSEAYSEWTRLTLNAMMDYERTFADCHNVSLMLGTEESSYRLDTFGAARLKYASSAIDQMFAGSADHSYWSTDGSADETARRSFFGRLNYDYKGKYMLSLIARYDGSENFPKDNRWGFFPGVSVGWRISQEPFVNTKVGSWLTDLKLRASYGEQGNDAINQFQYLTTYAYTSSTAYATQLGGSDANIIIPGTVPNVNVTWEVAKTWNIGLDGEIWNGLLSWEVDAFDTRRSNILCGRNASVPNYTGLSNLPDENIGIVDNKGFEFQLASSKKISNDFSYDIKGNFLFAKNKIKYMDETPWGTGHEYLKLEGHPMGSSLFYHVIGINRTTDDLKNNPQFPGATLGSFIYEDIDKDGAITSYDRRRCDLTTVPQIVYGLTMSARWKSFDATVLLQGQARARFYYAPLIDWRSGNVDKKSAEKAWTLTNTDSNYPRIAVRYGDADFYNESAAFIRLKNVEIGYTLPAHLLEGFGVSATRIYLAGYNLLTISPLKGIDPETSDVELQNYPQMRIFNTGIRMTF
jgi:TonB-linked SusC/RagA family outer membrane protein